MRSILLVSVLPALLGAAPALEIVRPIIAQSDGGAPTPARYEHFAGERLFFTCRIAGYSKSPEAKVHVAYSIQAFDPNGIPIVKSYKNELVTEVTPQDKEWMPKIETRVQVPPLVGSGTYQIVVKAEDVLAKTTAQLVVPFQVRGHDFEPSDTLVIQNFHFFRGEYGTQALDKPIYRQGNGVWANDKPIYCAGDGVWVSFDITGFKYGPNNGVDVSYVTSVIAPSGELLWTQLEPTVEQSESFYPKRYVAASFGISLQNNIRPGEYSIVVEVKDATGNQTGEIKQRFTVE